MSKFHINPSRGMRAWAIVLAISGAGSIIFSDRPSSRIIGAAMLLGAWEMAFVPAIPLNLTLGEIYRKTQQGWRLPKASRWINLVSTILIILSIYLRWHGR